MPRTDISAIALELNRSWTGRSAMSFATDSAISRLVTSGTFRTRVSQMRAAAPGIRARSTQRRGSGRTARG